MKRFVKAFAIRLVVAASLVGIVLGFGLWMYYAPLSGSIAFGTLVLLLVVGSWTATDVL